MSSTRKISYTRMVDSDRRLRIRKPSGGYAEAYSSPIVRQARAAQLVELLRQLAAISAEVAEELDLCLDHITTAPTATKGK